MKKITFTSALFILMSFSLFSQHIYTERSSGNMENVFYKRHLDNTNYTQIVNKENHKTYVKTQENTVEARNTEEVTLTINLEFDPIQFEVFGMIMIYDEFGFIDAIFPTANIVNMDIPEGTYDLYTVFSNLSSGQHHMIILEQQNIQGNTTLTMDVSDAINYISFNPIDENGLTLNPGVINPNTGNPSFIAIDKTISLITEEVNRQLINSRYYWDTPMSSEPVWNFYINNVSNRYAFISFLAGIEYPNGDYFTKFETLSGVNESLELKNNPDDWVFHIESFQPSLLGENSYYGFELGFIYEGKLFGNIEISSNKIINPLEGFKGFLNNPINDNPADLVVVPAIVDYVTILDPMWGEESFFLRGNSILTNEEGNILYGSGDIVSTGLNWANLDYYNNENFERKVLPFHPKFSFLKNNNLDIIQGDNVPVFISIPFMIPNIANQINGKYQGRYGENRETDNFATEVEVKQNGDVIFSDTFVEFFGTQLPNSGEIELVLTNANTLVDGLEGSNKTTIKYTADAEDYLPPTLQHLQFRNSQDQVTHVFNTAEEGHIRLAGGDFEYLMINEWSGYFDYNEGSTITLSYSLHNENEWTELEVTEYPEHFHMPAFGDYYEASLESVVVPAEDSWFDIKVLLTDAAGNTQEQIISPAFKVEQATMGVSESSKSNFIAYPNPFTDVVNIQLPEEIKGTYTLSVTDLSGKLVYTETKNSNSKNLIYNGSSLPSGVYILNVKSGNLTVAEKVIKK